MDDFHRFDRDFAPGLKQLGIIKRLRLQAKLSLCVVALIVAACGADSWAQSTAPTPTQTVIPNVIPSVSYIRLYALEPTVFEVRAIGGTSGVAYKTTTVSVEAYISKQIPASDFVTGVQLRPEDTTINLVAQGKREGLFDVAGLYQHVRYNSATRVLENMSECEINLAAHDLGLYREYFYRQTRFLPHVHTSRLGSYTSYISITNPDPVSRSFKLIGFEPGKPNSGPTIVVTVPAGGTVKYSVPQIEQQSGYVPRADLLHLNFTVAYVSDANAPSYLDTVVVTHTVRDDNSSVETNLAQFCPVEGVSTIAKPAGSVPYAQTRAETNICISGGWELWDPKNCPVIDFPASTATAGEPRGDTGVDGGFGSGGSANGQIYPSGDVDWYKARLDKGGAYKFYLTPTPVSFQVGGTYANDALYKSQIRLLSPTGSTIQLNGGQTLSRGRDNSIIFTPAEAGDYFVEVSASDGASTGGYQLVVNTIFKADLCSPLNPQDRFVAETSCNGTEADFPANDATPGLACISCRVGTGGSVLPASDVDWVRVQLVAGTTYTFVVTGSVHPGTKEPSRAEDGFAIKLKARLLSKSGTELKSANGTLLRFLLQDPDGDPEGPARFEYTATETGAHYIELSSRNTKPLSYSIQVNR